MPENKKAYEEAMKREEDEIRSLGQPRWGYKDYGIGLDYVPGVKSHLDDQAGLDSNGLVIDYMQGLARAEKPAFLGFAFYVAAQNTDIVMDFTTEMGAGTGMYWGYVFQMPKWSFNVAKVDEGMDVSPTHPDAYNLFVGQRQRIEGQIKQGLTSAAQAVTDYELLAHDSRRYKEILNYFRDERKRGDEHILRSLFVDRVDAHTGEGYSMITMAKRWPTIITDFIRMGQEKYKGETWTIDKVVQELDVTQAEATVLLTKNRLFQEWKTMFRPTVAERYSRIQAMVDARRNSIEEYKQWLRPYIIRHKIMKESGETGTSRLSTSAIAVPGFGAQYAFSNVRLWVWKAFPITERRKPAARTEDSIGGIDWIIDPLDDMVREWARRIEYKYRLEPGTFSDKVIRGLLKGWATKTDALQAEGAVLRMVPSEFYYVLFDLKFERGVIKVPPPAGGENEDLMINPMRTWIASQNVMLIHLLELEAKDLAFNRDIDEMLGTRSVEDSYLRQSKEMLLGRPPKEKGPNPAKRFMDGASDRYGRLKRRLGKYSNYFFRPGPYESAFYERVVKMYLVDVGGLYGQQVNFWKTRAGVE